MNIIRKIGETPAIDSLCRGHNGAIAVLMSARLDKALVDSSIHTLSTLERTIDLRQRRLRGDMVNKNTALKS